MMETFDHNPDHSDQVTAQKWFDYAAKIVVIKHGKEGSIAYTREGLSPREEFSGKSGQDVRCRDSYAAGFLYGLCRAGRLSEVWNTAVAAASIVISSHSCSDAMPTRQVNDYINVAIGARYV